MMTTIIVIRQWCSDCEPDPFRAILRSLKMPRSAKACFGHALAAFDRSKHNPLSLLSLSPSLPLSLPPSFPPALPPFPPSFPPVARLSSRDPERSSRLSRRSPRSHACEQKKAVRGGEQDSPASKWGQDKRFFAEVPQYNIIMA